MYVRGMSGEDLQDAIAALDAAVDQLAACQVDLLTRPDLVAALDTLENLGCRLPAVRHRLLARLQVEATPRQLGAKSWKEVLRVRWRLSGKEAHRRLTDAALLAPRPAVSGPALPPVLPATAAAQQQGLITAEHVEKIRHQVDELPPWVDAVTRDQFEVNLVRIALGVGPKELEEAAKRLVFLLDQDGPEPDDSERARKRGVTLTKQRRDGMSGLLGSLTPELAAMWEVIFAKFAAPGMCNPDDPEPCVSGTPTQAQIDNDFRSPAQRRHDAMVAVVRIALMSGDLGQLNGLPVSVIVRTTLQDLESRAGVATTGGGTIIPIKDVIRMAAHANCFLAIFDQATGSALDLFRTKRTASAAQRIMLTARDGGCTKPGCTIGAYGCQVHHADKDWGEGGNTNINDLGLACGTDNRDVKDGGWTTRVNDQHEVEWIPPADLDTGQTRVNTYHRPERLLADPDDSDNRVVSMEPVDEGGSNDAEQTAAPEAVADDSGDTDETPSADNTGEPDSAVASPETADANDIDDTKPYAEALEVSHEPGYTQTAAAVADRLHEPVGEGSAITLPADEAFCSMDPTTSETDADEPVPAEPDEPTRPADNPGEPGGPAPPQHRAA
ncbi:DUF222 domain-containing protein [Mycobacterium sp. GA-2829]|uniref:DUF222 domain-containing protein n=1 Tax=Mycobacterium sp. GA-2829 TaxID=1772283 RepID=UPI000740088C|nr:DUF222 domain-containing protein [Mycobacterium sp. GA-2829]KUI25355.1 hypothetical protein AU194_00175 [Mycobacterium sp. GA-2829]